MTDTNLIKIFKNAQNTKVPFWFMRQAGRHLPEYRELRAKAGSFLNLCFNSKQACEVTLQPVLRYKTDAAILFSDILTIPMLFNRKVEFITGKGPVLDPLNANEIQNLVYDTNKMDLLEPVFETVRLVKKQKPEQVTLIGFSGAPLTLACYMIEGSGSKTFDSLRIMAYQHPDKMDMLIKLLGTAIIDYLSQQIKAGAEVVQLFDSWAGLMPPDLFDRYVIEPAKIITTEIKKRFPHVYVTGFPKGAGLKYRDFAMQTGVDMLSVDHTVPLWFIKNELQPVCKVQGNLDPALLVAGGEAMEIAAMRILTTLDKPFVFNLGHGVVPATPPAHVAALAKLIKGYHHE